MIGSAGGVLIDAHAHLLPIGLPDLGAETGDSRWPLLVTDGDTGRIMRGSEVFRPVRRSCWDPAARLEEMDRHGVDVQIVSPVPVTLVDWADPVLAARYLADQNDRIAEAVAGSAGRLVGLGALPCQDPDLAVAELHRITGELGLAGVEIGTLNGGVELDEPRLRPIFAAAAEAEVPIFVHPVDGAGATRRADPFSAFGVGMLTDTALAAKALVFGGVLEDLPNLRVCLAHGGGAFPYVYPRLRVWATAIGIDGALLDADRLDRSVRRLHVDTLVFDQTLVELLMKRYGPHRVMFGSDDPFIAWDQVTATLTGGHGDTSSLRSQSAAAFFKLPASALPPEAE